MTLRTALTVRFGIDHPVVLAPMGGVAGGALAAAVSEGGGLGLIGAGSGNQRWVQRECGIAKAATSNPWGIGFLTWGLTHEVLDAAIAQEPSAIMLSFGDPKPFVDTIRATDIAVMVQVTSMEEARRALEVGADVIVAQGSEAGGHGGGRATLPFVPAVVDIAGTTPVLAAGGIADGRGLAAALTLGAAGAMIGTRFEATPEALLDADEVEAIIAAQTVDTTRGRAIDVASGAAWPEQYPARTLRNRFTDEWQGRESELDDSVRQLYLDAVARRDFDYVPIWAGEAVDMVTGSNDAAVVVAQIVAQADRAIDAVGRLRA
jgi:nitronate monooxygenase